MSLKLGKNLVSGSGVDTVKNSRHLLEPFWSDHILNDLDCLRADTFSWQSGDMYVSAYNHLLADINMKMVKTKYYKSNVSLNTTYVKDNKGVISNLSGYYLASRSGYVSEGCAIVNKKFRPGNNTWEAVVKCKTPTSFSASQERYDLMCCSDVGAFHTRVHVVNNVPLFELHVSYNGTTWDIADARGTHVVQPNTTYYIKVEFVNLEGTTYYRLRYSFDGVNYSNDIAVQSSTPVVQNSAVTLGAWDSYDHIHSVDGTLMYPWQGEIYLDGCYIKVANNIVWKGIEYLDYYDCDDGHKICPASQEYKLMNMFETTGVAWYYILDTVNKRFKLPRTKYGFSGLRTGVGDEVEPALPNIKGQAISSIRTDLSYYGTSQETIGSNFFTVGYFSNAGGKYQYASGSLGTSNTISVDASRCNDLYGKSKTVEVASTQMYLYFYVGDFNKTSEAQIAGINSELLNSKLDKSGGTMTGDLGINKEAPVVSLKNPDLDISSTTAPASPIGNFILFNDVNGTSVGILGAYHHENNNFELPNEVRRIVDGDLKKGYFNLFITPNGDDKISASAGVRNSIVDWCMPDYANQIVCDTLIFNYVQVLKDSFVTLWGRDPYTEEYAVFVTPEAGVQTYVVGYRYDDTNGNSEFCTFSFFVPKNWYFYCSAESGFCYRIFPLKGAQ